MNIRLPKFNKSKLKKDAREFFRIRNIWLYIIIFVFFVVLGLALHEAGHALAGLLVGASIEKYVICMRIFPPSWVGYVNYANYAALSTAAKGFVTMMGSTFTLLLSAAAVICLIKCKLKAHAKAAVFVMSLYFMDMFLYTLLGVLAAGTGYREALEGAMELGIPSAAFLAVAWIVTLLIIAGIIYSLLKPYLENSKRSP